MRRLFLLLMIVLLPLRGWIGDAMAIEMSQSMSPVASSLVSSLAASKTDNNTKLIANYLYLTWEKDHFGTHETKTVTAECPGHASKLPVAAAGSDAFATHSEGAPAAEEPPMGHCSTCSVCQICHSVVLASWQNASPAVLTAQTLPLTSSTPFASAFTALCQKPPIPEPS